MKHLPLPVTGLVVAAALALAACSKSPDPATPAAPRAATSATAKAPQDGTDTADGIAWKKASSDADIEAAFATARAESKPVFLYWGAKWCPPCNQVQATLFNRQDFAAQSKSFVAVHIDGDRPAAQKQQLAWSTPNEVVRLEVWLCHRGGLQWRRSTSLKRSSRSCGR